MWRGVMVGHFKSILPTDSKETTANRAERDRQIYQAGRELAIKKLSIDTGVQYTNEQDQICFNMGYEAGLL